MERPAHHIPDRNALVGLSAGHLERLPIQFDVDPVPPEPVQEVVQTLGQVRPARLAQQLLEGDHFLIR
jgi:hypothetical protein